MILSRYTLKNITSENVVLPDEALFELPEKVLQFGTGFLLRGLPDYVIDKANRQSVFNGRIVVVKSTTQGEISAFEKQDGLYTHCIRDVENGLELKENIINSSISRVLDANTEWKQVLDCAHNRNIQIIVSNTTEIGIKLVQEDVLRHPPISFPGKLLAFLYERFKAFGGSDRSGLIIVPTELFPDNGKKLESIVLELAHLNGLEDSFIEWLENCNHFCNSIVDRIVPSKLDSALLADIKAQLGYTDKLLTLSEAYYLWVIEGNDYVKNCLSFAEVDKSVIITPDIDVNSETRFRLLNGTHTLSCGLAFLAGCNTIKEAMDNERTSAFIFNLLFTEIAPSIPFGIDQTLVEDFRNNVLKRLSNPHIHHKCINITVQYSSKMKLYYIPILLNHYKNDKSVPELLALSFAAYLCFMKASKKADGKFYGQRNGEDYPIIDDQAELFYKRWNSLSTTALVKEVLRDSSFWGTELNTPPGFQQAVINNLNILIQEGAWKAINAVNLKKEFIA